MYHTVPLCSISMIQDTQQGKLSPVIGTASVVTPVSVALRTPASTNVVPSLPVPFISPVSPSGWNGAGKRDAVIVCAFTTPATNPFSDIFLSFLTVTATVCIRNRDRHMLTSDDSQNAQDKQMTWTRPHL